MKHLEVLIPPIYGPSSVLAALLFVSIEVLYLGVDTAPQLLDFCEVFLLANDLLHNLVAMPIDPLKALIEVDNALDEVSWETSLKAVWVPLTTDQGLQIFHLFREILVVLVIACEELGSERRLEVQFPKTASNTRELRLKVGHGVSVDLFLLPWLRANLINNHGLFLLRKLRYHLSLRFLELLLECRSLDVVALDDAGTVLIVLADDLFRTNLVPLLLHLIAGFEVVSVMPQLAL